MAEIVRKIGKITKYETKSYVGRARILDLDRATASDELSLEDERAARDTDAPGGGGVAQDSAAPTSHAK